MVVSAHGAYIYADLKPSLRPVVALPAGLTVELLGPHNYALSDPYLGIVVDGKYRAYATFHADRLEQPEVHFHREIPENVENMPADFVPNDPLNVLGPNEGLHNYRQWSYLKESPEEVAKVLSVNRQSEFEQGRRSDVLLIGDEVDSISQTLDQEVPTSYQQTIDGIASGKFVNSAGEKYKRVVFSTCRSYALDLNGHAYKIVRDYGPNKGGDRAERGLLDITTYTQVENSNVYKKYTLEIPIRFALDYEMDSPFDFLTPSPGIKVKIDSVVMSEIVNDRVLYPKVGR